MIEIKALDKLRELVADINAKEIVDHMQLYPSAVFDCKWLDIWHSEFNRIVESLEAEIADRYMLQPVDRSGETWRIGDKFAFAGADGKKHICTVSGVSDCEVFFYYDEHSNSTKHRHFTARAIAHVKPRTLEDILNDHLQEREKIVRKLESSLITLGEAESEEKACDKLFADAIRELFGGDAE